MMNVTPPWLAACWLTAAACAPSAQAPSGPTEARECAVRLAPLATEARAEPPSGEASWVEPSLVVLNVELPLAPEREKLEKRIPRRLAEGRFGRGRGLAYLAERETLSLTVSGGSARVDVPLRVEISECDDDRCKPICNLQGAARAQVPLTLTPDYGFQPSKVSLRFTQGCSVRVLGFLTVSVTPQLEGLLRPQLDEIARQIDAELPDLRPRATQAWAELNRPRELPLGTCVALAPTGLVQGPIADSEQSLLARFGIIAEPELRPRCDASPAPSALPRLQTDATMPEDGVVMLGMSMPLTKLEQAFTTAAPPPAMRIASASATARGSEVDIELELTGRACGRVAFSAQPSFEAQGQYIGLGHAELSEPERKRWLSAGLDPTPTLAGLGSLPRIVPPLSVEGLRAAVPVVGSAELGDGFSLRTRLLSTRAAGAAARRRATEERGQAELVAWLEARGSIRLAATP